MSWKQVLLRPETLIDKMDFTVRVNWPTLRGNIRRKDPDGGSPDPYFQGLNTTTLNIVQFGDNNAVYNVTFTGDSMATALNDINIIDPTNLKAEDDNGYLRVTNLNGGNKNGITILSGTGAAILGFEIFPMPQSTSVAGEVSTSPSGWPTQSNTQSSKLVARDEGLSSFTLNRALMGILTQMNMREAEFEKEIAIPIAVDITVNGGKFSINTADRLFTFANGTTAANPTATNIEKFITLLNTDNTPIFVGTDRARVDAVTYGTPVDQTTSFTAWGTVDGKSIFGNGVWSLTKATGSISAISGNILYVPGANFITNNCNQNDTVIITGATNNTPFNHNGEYYIDTVIDANHIAVRPKNQLDLFSNSNEAPSSLNLTKQVGENYGTATIPVGKFIPLSMKTSTAVFSILPSTIPNGTYRAILPIGKSLKQILQPDLTAPIIPNPSGGQIELGSKLSTNAADALKPRIITGFSSGGPLTLIQEFPSSVNNTFNVRIYADLLLGSIPSYVITVNARWDGTNWNKDLNNSSASIFSQTFNGISVAARPALNNAAWTDLQWQNTASISASGDATDTTDFWNGVAVGEGTAPTDPELLFLMKTAGTYSLISTARLDAGSGSLIRTYNHKAGYVAVTINAAWDGAKWVKDVSSNPCFKFVTSATGNYQFMYSTAGADFLDTAWTSRDDLRHFTLSDDFMQNIAFTNTVNTMYGNYRLTAATNINVGSGVADNIDNIYFHGSLFGTTPGAGAFTCTLSAGNAIPAAGDFIFRTRLKSFNRTELDTLENNGLFIGNIDGNFTFGIARGNNQPNFYAVYGDGVGAITRTDIGTIGASNETMDVSMERIGGRLYVYVNNVLAFSTAYTVSFANFQSKVFTVGSATGSDAIFAIDYIKLWLPTPNS